MPLIKQETKEKYLEKYKDYKEKVIIFLAANTNLITTIVVITVVVFSVYKFSKKYFVVGSINAWEQRFYVWVGLGLLVVTNFAILRMYNAVVVNSKFLLALKNEMRFLSKQLKSSDKIMESLKDALQSAATKISNTFKKDKE